MLDFFKEIFTAARSTAVERVKSPVVGALFFSWIAFNWDNILVMLFSAATIENKIVMIKDNSTIFTAIIWPVVSAAFISMVLPVISAMVIWGQNKPTMFSMGKYAIRNDAILDRRIETEKKRAQADIAYEKEKTGEQSEIQEMKVTIENSKKQTGEITKEKDELVTEKKILISEKENLILENAVLRKNLNKVIEDNRNNTKNTGELNLSGQNIKISKTIAQAIVDGKSIPRAIVRAKNGVVTVNSEDE